MQTLNFTHPSRPWPLPAAALMFLFLLAGCLRAEAAEAYDPASTTRAVPPVDLNQVQPAMPTPASVSQSELEAAFELRLDTARPHLRADILLLPSRAPVEIVADLRRVGALPGFFREKQRVYNWRASSGKVHAADPTTSPGLAVFMPPETSDHVRIHAEVEITLERPASGGVETVKIVKTGEFHLLTPAASTGMYGGILDGYAIGEYLDPAKHPENRQVKLHQDRYQIPQWFYKITPDLKSKKIAPDIELGFFTIDFPWKSLGMPQYIALDPNLVQKLQDLIELMRADGHAITQFVPIYGFRPPSFNLGKIADEAETTLKVPFSMHQYGRAADFIIDENGDGLLDDLNGDGLLDVHDAVVIMRYVNQLDRRYRAEGRMEMVGGAGLYTHNDFLERAAALGQTPYVHVDTRGFLEEDGTLVRWPAKWDNGEYIRWSKL